MFDYIRPNRIGSFRDRSLGQGCQSIFEFSSRMNLDVAITVASTASLILWTVQLLPQIYHNYRRKSTEGLSLAMLLIWFPGAVISAGYNYASALAIPLIIQQHIFSFLAAICILQDVYYGGGIRHRLPRWCCGAKTRSRKQDESVDLVLEEKTNATLVDIGVDASDVTDDAQTAHDGPQRRVVFVDIAVVVMALSVTWLFLEGLMVWGYSATKSDTSSTPHRFFLGLAVIPGILTVVGFVPQYATILKNKTCGGLSVWFLLGDFFGGVFGIASLILESQVKGHFDIYAALLYIIVTTGNFGLLMLYGFFDTRLRSYFCLG